MADDFTFTSANNDDHISKSEFKTRCWQSQIGFIERFELERVIGSGSGSGSGSAGASDAFVLYVCRTKYGKIFRNVEYFRLRDNRVKAI